MPKFIIYDKAKTDGIEQGKITARYGDSMPIKEIIERTNVSEDVVGTVLRDVGMVKG